MKILGVLTRIYLSLSELDNTISFYEVLFGEECRMRFKHHEVGLELAWVGSVLLIAGSQDKLKPFKSTSATFLVDSIDNYMGILLEQGAIILEEPRSAPIRLNDTRSGRNMRVRHPDGMVIEYVEHIQQE